MFCEKKKTVLFTSPIILLLPYKNYIIRIYTYELWCYSSIYTIFEKLIDVNLFNNMYFLVSVISINPSCGTCVSSLQGILVETIFRFLFWKYWELQGCSPVNLLHIFRTEQVSWRDASTFLLLLWNI